jgi:hypothetical protein
MFTLEWRSLSAATWSKVPRRTYDNSREAYTAAAALSGGLGALVRVVPA